MKSILTTLLFLLLTTTAFSFNPSDSIKARAIFDEGERLYRSGEYEAAISKFEKSSSLFKFSQNYRPYLGSLGMIVKSNYQLKHFKKSISASNKIINESRRLFTTPSGFEVSANLHIAKATMMISNPDSALVYSTRAMKILEQNIDITNRKIRFENCYNIRAMLYNYKSRFDSTLYYARKSLNLRLEVYGKNSLEYAEMINNIGIIYLGLTEYNLAIEHFKTANNIRNFLNINAPESTSQSYASLGDAYIRLGNYNESLINYFKGLSELEKINMGEDALLFRCIGSSYRSLNNLDSAYYYLNKSLHVYTKTLGNESYNFGDVYSELGQVYEKKNKLNEAFKYYKKSIDVYMKLVGNKNIEVAHAHYLLAQNSRKQLNYMEAVAFADKSIESNLINFEYDKNFIDTPILNNFRSYAYLLSSIFVKSLSKEKIHKNNQQKKYLVESNSTYNLGCQIIDSLKSTFTTSADKIELLNVSKDIFEGTIRTNLMLSKLNKKASNSLQIIQNYKSTLLLDNNEINDGLSDSLKIEIRKARKDFSNLRSKILKEEAKSTKDSTNLFELKVALFDLKRKKEHIESNANPNIKAQLNSSYTSAQQVMDSLDTNTMVLEYFVGDSGIYLFAISKDDYIIKEIEKSITFSEDIESLNESMKNPASFAKKSWGLYQKLIIPANISKKIKNIIVIPDGILWKLNFETLLTNNSKSNDFSNMPFLLKKYSISYASTSNFNKQSKKKKTNNHKMLAFSYSELGDNDFGGLLSLNHFRDSNKKLPGSSKEIKEISNIIDGDYHYGNKASENVFKTRSSDYQIIHMALHGEANEEKPDESRLIFYSKKDTLDDGLLFGFELANMELNADLVVLSACNTGAGKIENGVGIMSLSRSFSTAGVHSLLLSKWEVSDVTAPFILKYFYEGLKQGMRKSEALKLAKLKFLENNADNITASPYYWNSFYILGDDSPIIFENSNSYWKQLLIGLMILLVIGGFLWNRSISKVA